MRILKSISDSILYDADIEIIGGRVYYKSTDATAGDKSGHDQRITADCSQI